MASEFRFASKRLWNVERRSAKELQASKDTDMRARSSQENFKKGPKSRIGPVNVPEPKGAQNSNSGGLEAAILDTLITFEASQGATSHFDGRVTHLIVGGLGPARQASKK